MNKLGKIFWTSPIALPLLIISTVAIIGGLRLKDGDAILFASFIILSCSGKIWMNKLELELDKCKEVKN